MIRDISVTYDRVSVIGDLSLELKPKELGCLLGPSGCGKSTLLRAIAGFQPLNSGEIWLDNRLLSSTSQSLLPESRGVGMVFQDIALFPHLTVAENIGFGLSNWSEMNRVDRVAELLQLIGLSGLDARYPHELSGGQQQRVALARAMAPKPSLLLLDEPFAALDNLSREMISTELVSIIKKKSMTVVMVTHSVEEAALLSDEVLVTGMAPIKIEKSFLPPKNRTGISWQQIGLRKSLQNKDFQNYIKLIRDTSYKVFKKESAI